MPSKNINKLSIFFATASKCTKHIYLHLFTCAISLSLYGSLECVFVYAFLCNSLQRRSHPLFLFSTCFPRIHFVVCFERHMSMYSGTYGFNCNFANDFPTSILTEHTINMVDFVFASCDLCFTVCFLCAIFFPFKWNKTYFHKCHVCVCLNIVYSNITSHNISKWNSFAGKVKCDKNCGHIFIYILAGGKTFYSLQMEPVTTKAVRTKSFQKPYLSIHFSLCKSIWIISPIIHANLLVHHFSHFNKCVFFSCVSKYWCINVMNSFCWMWNYISCMRIFWNFNQSN